jgi:hypothetical protein
LNRNTPMSRYSRRHAGSRAAAAKPPSKAPRAARRWTGRTMRTRSHGPGVPGEGVYALGPMIGYTGMDLPRFSLLGPRSPMADLRHRGRRCGAGLVVSLLQPDRYEARRTCSSAPHQRRRDRHGRAAPTRRGSRAGGRHESRPRFAWTCGGAREGAPPPPEPIDEIKHAVTVDVTAPPMSPPSTLRRAPGLAAKMANGFATEVTAVRRQAARTDIQRASTR